MAIVNNMSEILPIAAPIKIEGIPEQVFVSVPRKLEAKIGPSLYEKLPQNEQQEIIRTAHAIYKTYITLTGNL